MFPWRWAGHDFRRVPQTCLNPKALCTNGCGQLLHKPQKCVPVRIWPKTWNGALSKNPVSLRNRYGGRWLTDEFEAGDMLIFGMHTIHASLDNHSSQIRLSSDSRYQLASEPVDERWVGANPIGHSVAFRKGRIC